MANWNPKGSAKALLDNILEQKFSKYVPLVVILLGAVYAVYRSQHYMATVFFLPPHVSWPTAIFIEALVLAASAAVFIAQREAFIAELRGEDEHLARWSVFLTLTLLGFAFVALLGVAWSDAWEVTKKHAPAFLMVLAQGAQAGMIVAFIVFALLDERKLLRVEYAAFVRQTAQGCPYCQAQVASNNRKRHIEACPLNPKNMPTPQPTP